MYLSPRERAGIRALAAFQQLTVNQLHQLLFPDHPSRTTAVNLLNRLRKSHLVSRIPHRVVGGEYGGSGSYVYVLSSAGRQLAGLDGRQRTTRVNYHALAVADCVIVLKQAERAGRIRIDRLEVEPLTVVGQELQPDVLVELSGASRTAVIALETDMGTEGIKQLTAKLQRYYKAFQVYDTDMYPLFPLVLWVCIDEERARELKRIISAMPEEARQLFRVRTMDGLASVFV
jgi:hypothetical protein